MWNIKVDIILEKKRIKIEKLSEYVLFSFVINFVYMNSKKESGAIEVFL